MGEDKQYNIDMKHRRDQSTLGRKRVDVYGDADSTNTLLLATVTKVNYLYNTVDVVTTRHNETLGKSRDSEGRLSARLPVPFGGSWSNGMSYGSVVPITIGDLVLIGFIDGDFNSPIVINTYKSDAVARNLSYNNKISGNPENIDDYRTAMSHKTVYPSLSSDINWGDGTFTKTYAGDTFLVTSTTNQAQGVLDDTYMTIEDIAGVFNGKGELIRPMNEAIPRLLFQHGTQGNTSNKTTIFLDEFGTFRLSKVLMDNKKRSYFEMDNKGKIGIRHRPDSVEPLRELMDDETPTEPTDAYIGIDNGVPTISSGKYKVEVTDGTLLVNGETLEEILYRYTEELESTLTEVTRKISELKAVVDQIDLEVLKTLQQSVKSLIVDVRKLKEITDAQGKKITLLSDTLTEFIGTTYSLFVEAVTHRLDELETGYGRLSTELSDARGTFDSLEYRLADMTKTNENLTERVRALESTVPVLISTVIVENTTTYTHTFNTPLEVEPIIQAQSRVGTIITWKFTYDNLNKITNVIFSLPNPSSTPTPVNAIIHTR